MMSGNAALRKALDEASEIRLPQVYIETIEQLRRKFGHSILILPDGNDRITRFNCFAYGLGLWDKDDYIRRVNAANNSAIVNSLFVRALLDDALLLEISAEESAPGNVLLYFDKEAVTHAAVVGDHQRYRSKWGGNEVHEHGLWDVPAQYGNKVRHYRAPAAPSILSRLDILQR